MKTFFKIAATSIVLAFTATTAYAEEMKPYVGIGLGSFTTDYGNLAGAAVKSDNSFGGFLQSGVEFNPYIAAELRIGSVSESNIKNINLLQSKVDWFTSYLLKPQFPATEHLNIYGLIGATTAKVTLSFLGQGSSQTKTQVSFGGGFEYAVQDTVSIGVEYVQYSNNADGANSKTKITGISATANYHF